MQGTGHTSLSFIFSFDVWCGIGGLLAKGVHALFREKLCCAENQ